MLALKPPLEPSSPCDWGQLLAFISLLSTSSVKSDSLTSICRLLSFQKHSQTLGWTTFTWKTPNKLAFNTLNHKHNNISWNVILIKTLLLCTFLWWWTSASPDFWVLCEMGWMLSPLTFSSDFPTFWVPCTVLLRTPDAFWRISWTTEILKKKEKH